MSAPVDANDVLFGSGIPAASFQSYGDVYAGPITKLEAVQQREFDRNNKPTDVLATWPDGSPKMMAVATLRTQHRDPSDPSDDGQRKVYIASRDMQQKVRDAVKRAGQRKLDIGGILSVAYTHQETGESGVPAKIYAVDYTPAAAGAANAALGIQQQIQQSGYVQGPPVQQQPQYQAPADPGGYYAQVPPIGQLMGQTQLGQVQPPVNTAQPVQQPVQQAAAAPAPQGMGDLNPEAQALVQRMLAQQQATGQGIPV
jgi:hypothetical protein